jgi:sterol desaturase/sphingolipid hydroxylase (fatty acid hydroxylase superfamily)
MIDFVNYVGLMLRKTIGCIILFCLMEKTLNYKYGNQWDDFNFSIQMYIFYNILTKPLILFYYLCDKYNWFSKYLINSDKKTPGDILFKGIMSNILKLFLDPFTNLFIVKLSNINKELPTYPNAFAIAFFIYFISDFIFYFIHRIIHHKNFYWMHKQHHLFNYTNVLGAEYASIFEVLFSSESFLFVIFYIGFSIHPLLWFSILYFKLFVNIELHSGYQLPYNIAGIASTHHCLHHLLPYKGRYSEHPFIDILFKDYNIGSYFY